MDENQKAIASAAAKGGETVEAMIERYAELDPDYAEKLKTLWDGGREAPSSEDQGRERTSR